MGEEDPNMEGLNETEVDRLCVLENFGSARNVTHEKKGYRVTVSGDVHTTMTFYMTAMSDGREISFVLGRSVEGQDSRSLEYLKGADLSWIKAFLNGYEIVEDEV